MRERIRVGLKCEDPSLAQQHEAASADINVIVKNFGVTGMLPQHSRPPLQADFMEAISFQEAQDMIIRAEKSFMGMPGEVRARFQNDVGAFVDFCSDASNLAEMRKLGLAPPEPIVAAVVAPAVPAVAPVVEAPKAP